MHIVQIKAECWWLHSNPEKEVPEDYFPLWIAINNPTATESIRGPQSLFINVPEFGPKPPAFANLQRATLITDPTQLRQDHFGHCLTRAIHRDSILCLATHRWNMVNPWNIQHQTINVCRFWQNLQEKSLFFNRFSMEIMVFQWVFKVFSPRWRLQPCFSCQSLNSPDTRARRRWSAADRVPPL